MQTKGAFCHAWSIFVFYDATSGTCLRHLSEVCIFSHIFFSSAAISITQCLFCLLGQINQRMLTVVNHLQSPIKRPLHGRFILEFEGDRSCVWIFWHIRQDELRNANDYRSFRVEIDVKVSENIHQSSCAYQLQRDLGKEDGDGGRGGAISL